MPGYLKAFDDLRKEGISQIVCVAVSDPAAADAWGKKIGADGSKVLMAADPIQAATRILGMELAEPSEPGPKSLRYAAILDNGVILKMVSTMQKEKIVFCSFFSRGVKLIFSFFLTFFLLLTICRKWTRLLVTAKNLAQDLS